MAVAPMLMPTTTTTRGPDQLRLAGCPRCAGRARTLTEETSGLVARCLGCGWVFVDPLGTVREPSVTLVGRAGQRVGAGAA